MESPVSVAQSPVSMHATSPVRVQAQSPVSVQPQSAGSVQAQSPVNMQAQSSVRVQKNQCKSEIVNESQNMQSAFTQFYIYKLKLHRCSKLLCHSFSLLILQNK